MCVESMLRLDFEGLRLLAARGYDFRAVQANPRIAAFAREAMREGSLEQLSALRGIGYDYSALLAEAAAAGELSESLRLDRAVTTGGPPRRRAGPPGMGRLRISGGLDRRSIRFACGLPSSPERDNSPGQRRPRLALWRASFFQASFWRRSSCPGSRADLPARPYRPRISSSAKAKPDSPLFVKARALSVERIFETSLGPLGGLRP